MNGPDEPNLQDSFTPKEISQWARQEVADSAKAFELRTKEAMDLATQYAAGEISPEEAKDRLLAFNRRWREALYGASTNENLSNEQIVAKIDEARLNAKTPFSERFGSQGGAGVKR